MRIAVPIIAESMDEALGDMDKAERVADIIELRIDYIRKPNLRELLGYNKIPKIVTNRAADEGGRFNGLEKERTRFLERAIELGAEYVDIEWKHYCHLEGGSSKLIVSYHNFEETPEELAEIYNKIIGETNPNIVKIATFARSYEDSLRMLELIALAHREGRDIVGICMGDKGIITRVYGPALGGYLTFASLGEGKASAPGQLSADELRRVWEVLGLE